MKFKHYPNRSETLTKEFVEQEFAKLDARVDPAEKSDSPKEWIALYSDLNALSGYFSGESSRINYAHSQDMTNKKWDETDKYFREQVTPAMEDGSAKMIDAILKSRHRDAIGEHFG